ncbi:MAG: cyclic nucleotide-binding domain-containing protein [Deltaproteobacteria bacterium]|nr:cyclic nucleotide-binding domain-containing protein [Deltaproteobacteria bacterium]
MGSTPYPALQLCQPLLDAAKGVALDQGAAHTPSIAGASVNTIGDLRLDQPQPSGVVRFFRHGDAMTRESPLLKRPRSGHTGAKKTDVVLKAVDGLFDHKEVSLKDAAGVVITLINMVKNHTHPQERAASQKGLATVMDFLRKLVTEGKLSLEEEATTQNSRTVMLLRLALCLDESLKNDNPHVRHVLLNHPDPQVITWSYYLLRALAPEQFAAMWIKEGRHHASIWLVNPRDEKALLALSLLADAASAGDPWATHTLIDIVAGRFYHLHSEKERLIQAKASEIYDSLNLTTRLTPRISAAASGIETATYVDNNKTICYCVTPVLKKHNITPHPEHAARDAYRIAGKIAEEVGTAYVRIQTIRQPDGLLVHRRSIWSSSDPCHLYSGEHTVVYYRDASGCEWIVDPHALDPICPADEYHTRYFAGQNIEVSELRIDHYGEKHPELKDIFPGCSFEQLVTLFRRQGDFELLDPDTVLMTKGETADKMYYLLEGELEVDLGDKKITLSSKRPEQRIVGEMAMFHGRTRTATVRAKDVCAVLVLDYSEVAKHLSTNSQDALRQLDRSRSAVWPRIEIGGRETALIQMGAQPRQKLVEALLKHDAARSAVLALASLEEGRDQVHLTEAQFAGEGQFKWVVRLAYEHGAQMLVDHVALRFYKRGNAQPSYVHRSARAEKENLDMWNAIGGPWGRMAVQFFDYIPREAYPELTAFFDNAKIAGVSIGEFINVPRATSIGDTGLTEAHAIDAVSFLVAGWLARHQDDRTGALRLEDMTGPSIQDPKPRNLILAATKKSEAHIMILDAGITVWVNFEDLITSILNPCVQLFCGNSAGLKYQTILQKGIERGFRAYARNKFVYGRITFDEWACEMRKMELLIKYMYGEPWLRNTALQIKNDLLMRRQDQP